MWLTQGINMILLFLKKLCLNIFTLLINLLFFQSFILTRFKLQIRVLDCTGSTSLVLFDKDVVSLIGKTALEILNDLDKVISTS